MKKIILLLVVFLLLSNTQTFGQQVPKNYVVVEIGTGTWCGYCPGAAMGADDLVENGHQVAIIENHNGDSYANSASNARNSYNDVPGFPTTYFNGQFQLVGGNATTSIYDLYLPKYNAAKSIMSDFTLDMSYTHVGLDYSVTINLDEVADYSNSNLRVHLALTESHIPENWGGGLTEVNFVNRAMYPSASGTSYSGGTQTITINFTASAAWDLQHSELVAFVQDYGTKEILQVDKKTLAEPVGTNNVNIAGVEDIPDNCDGVIVPTVLVQNYGTEELNSFTINYSINDGATTGSYDWSGSLGTFDTEHVVLEGIDVDVLAENSITFEVLEVNGTSDDDISNNTYEAGFYLAHQMSDDVLNIHINADANGDEKTWTITNSAGVVVQSGGPYENNVAVNESINLSPDCYEFKLYDSGNNGGSPVYVYDSASYMLIQSNGFYGSSLSCNFSVSDTESDHDEAFANTLIYPNPTSTSLNISNAEGLDVSLFDVLGREVLTRKNIALDEVIDVTTLQEGTYFIKLSNAYLSKTERLIIKK